MADGLGRVPIETEVAAGDGEIGRNREFFIGSGAEQSAVVSNAEAQLGGGRLGGAEANLLDQVQLGGTSGTWSGRIRLLSRAWHGVRIGYGE